MKFKSLTCKLGRRKRFSLLGFLCIVLSHLSVSDAVAQSPNMKIRIIIDGEVATATLDKTSVADDFAAQLPLNLILVNYAGIERIADLPRKLSVQGAPSGMTPVAGDITYYAPWGNLAFFAQDGVYATGLVQLGKVEVGLRLLQRPGPLHARIERVVD